MHLNSYLYGEGVEIPDIPAEILLTRITPLKEHLEEMNEISFADRTYEDTIQMGEIHKAIDFWERINER